jgi:isoleucyl-tRNA synthetase
MNKNDLKKNALDNIDKTNFFPSIGKNRIQGMIETRPDWCISRQRFWGVPLPIFIDSETHEPIIDDEINSKIYEIFKKEGSDAWYKRSISDFIGEKYDSKKYKKVEDIVEVWFDSGSSHTYVLENRDDLSWPADMYLEGSDQHRGWFHSSLLHSSGTRGKAPYKSILTHGFVVDGKGQKMSKSLGNVVAPDEIIKKNGADILRLWVVASDYSEDLRIDQAIIAQHSESYRKIRNTLRFLLGNILDDFSFSNFENFKFKNIDILDSFILNKISQLDKTFSQFENMNQYHKIYIELLNFCTLDLSSLYFDIRKDCLYCDDEKSLKRQNCIKVLKTSLYFLVKWLHPILVFTTEEVFQTLKSNKINSENIDESIFLIDFKNIDLDKTIEFEEKIWKILQKVKDNINIIFEKMRDDKVIKSGLETKVFIGTTDKFKSIFDKINLSDFLVCSSVEINNQAKKNELKSLDGIDGIQILVEKAKGTKCERCWKIFENGCERCQKISLS